MTEPPAPTRDPAALGVTAVWTTIARAYEDQLPDPLFSDPFAHDLIKASDVDTSRAHLMAGAESVFGDMFALRTRFLDDVCDDLMDDHPGASRQVVDLGAGLDARAYRLDWPSGTRLFELDLTSMLAFKADVLDRLAVPTCERVPVAVDFRGDWVTPLRASGFDTSRPTLWLVEGLLGYLPRDLLLRLLASLHQLSAAGSRIVYDQFRPGHFDTELTRATYDALGIDVIGMSPEDHDLRVDRWLETHGWMTSGLTVAEYAPQHGRVVPPALDPEDSRGIGVLDPPYLFVDAILP